MTSQQPDGRIDIRIAILGLVLGAHALLVFALAGGLPWLAGRASELPIEIKLIGAAAPAAPAIVTPAPLPHPHEAPRPRVTQAPPPRPASRVAAPAPQASPPASQAAAASVPPLQPAGPAGTPQPVDTAPASHQPVRVAAQALAKDCATPQYPRKAFRYNEQGTVTLALLVGIDGRVVDSHIAQSSGHKDLDDAALAALSLCRFQPGTADGKPEQSWAMLRYQWKIE